MHAQGPEYARGILVRLPHCPPETMAHIQYLTQIHLDHGAVRQLPAECARIGMRKPLLVSDAGVRAAGVLAQAQAALGDLPHAVFDGTPSNPTEAATKLALELYREHGCDGLVAVGGGSSMDLAKAVALLEDILTNHRPSYFSLRSCLKELFSGAHS